MIAEGQGAVISRRMKAFPKKWVWIGAAVLLGGGGAVEFMRGRIQAAASSIDNIADVPTVAVERVSRESMQDALMLSAEFLPYQAISVHAKVTGYVQSIKVDIGDHVKPGQSLAVLEIPELRNDVQHAEAGFLSSEQEVHKAEANYEEAHLAYSRLVGVAKENPKLIAQQDLETAKAKDEDAHSTLESNRQRVAASQSDVDKMRAMLGYASITAPFAGVITKRYVDTGALIQAGSSTQGIPLVDLAEDDRLRLVFPVPESAVGKIRNGKPVEISVDSLKDVFQGLVARYSGRVDTSTRTMKAEVDVPNETGKFTPGMYASVRLILENRTDALCVPLQALASGPQTTVMVLNSAQQIEVCQVTVGLQTSTMAEITSGLHEGDLVIVGNRAALHPGQKASGRITDLAAK